MWNPFRRRNVLILEEWHPVFSDDQYHQTEAEIERDRRWGEEEEEEEESIDEFLSFLHEDEDSDLEDEDLNLDLDDLDVDDSSFFDDLD